MKIDNKNNKLGLLLALALLVAASPAAAADYAAPSGPPSSAVAVPTMPAQAEPSSADIHIKSPVRAEALPPPVVSRTASRNIERNDAGVPSSVKSIITDLNNGESSTTLGDLNTARQAVARLDALINIEKKLVELDKLRAEQKKQEKPEPVISAIPASVLRAAAPVPAEPPPPMRSNVEVTGIEGSSGHFTAFIKEADISHPVHVGDHLPDGSKVLAIMADGIELQKSGKARLVRVKGVETVFGNLP